MKIEVLRKHLFLENDRAAGANRELLDRHGVFGVNVMGGAGCGKTALLERLLPRLKRGLRPAVLEGDVATTNDAERIAALGVPVVQLLTEGGCHLSATLVAEGLKLLPLNELDVVLIENVGNPICPANFDLGEHVRLVLLSVAEGDDKPAKYPHLFQVASAVVLTKSDLLSSTNFRVDRAMATLRSLAPEVPVFTTSSQDPASIRGVEDWLLSCASFNPSSSNRRRSVPQPRADTPKACPHSADS